jgi:hypothetical protein
VSITATDRQRPNKRRGRPTYVWIALGALGLRLGRELFGRVAVAQLGGFGVLLAFIAGPVVLLTWRARNRRRIAAQGGIDLTPAAIAEQLEASGIAPAFEGDGTLLGASVVVVNQRAKVLEVNTEYELFGADGASLGTVQQVGQSRGKRAARLLTPFDQFFTHRFVVSDGDRVPLLGVVRPAKLFKSRVHVADAFGNVTGTIRQRNVFWKIRFDMLDAHDRRVGQIRGRNVRAWDWDIVDEAGEVVGTIFKSWEGWGRTAFTRADRYFVRIERPLPEPLRTLAAIGALAIDLALKQDARGFG